MKRILKSIALTLATLFALVPAFAGQSWQLAGSIYKSAIPFVIPSSGTFSTNGAVTLSTALPTTYASAYLYFPAGAICSGSTAGLYYTVMSSTTVGTVYNNTYTSGLPTIPGTPTTYTCGTAPGAYTQVLTAQTLITYPLSGGFLTANGTLWFRESWSMANTANAKTLTTALGGSSVFAPALSSQAHAEADITTENRGSTSSQASNGGIFETGGSSITYTTVATASNQNITTSGQLANASDFIVLEQMQILAMP